MEERFEDVPIKVSDRDRYGYVKLTSYMDYYKNIVFNADKDDHVHPAGLTANNRNYSY